MAFVKGIVSGVERTFYADTLAEAVALLREALES